MKPLKVCKCGGELKSSPSGMMKVCLKCGKTFKGAEFKQFVTDRQEE